MLRGHSCSIASLGRTEPPACACLQKSGAVRQSEDALGRARQILPDEHFKQQSTLGASYKHCTKVRGEATKELTCPLACRLAWEKGEGGMLHGSRRAA